MALGLALIFATAFQLPARFAGWKMSRTQAVTSTLLAFTASSSTPLDALTTSTSQYRLFIPKIGVDMPIVVDEPNETKGLSLGAWHIPGTADPTNVNGYGNFVLGGHRYLHTSGPETFFDLDKLEVGDTVSVLWNGKVYAYVVDASKVVPPTEVSVLNPSKTKILTLFTCTPVFTTKERLVVTARLK